MRALLIAALGAVLFVGVGCQNKDEEMGSSSSTMSKDSTSSSMKTDACKHCPDVQVANAQGKCPVCGMQVK